MMTRLTRPIEFEALEDRLLFSATPVVTLDVKPETEAVDLHTEVMLNETFHFTATFENQGDPIPPHHVGYGPYVGVKIASGLELISEQPTYLGQPIELIEKYHNSTSETVTYEHAYGGEITLAAGETFYLYDLPFGSFVPGQEPVKLDFAARALTIAGAVYNEGLGIEVTGGFRFGKDPKDNPSQDEPLFAATSSAIVTPTVWEVTKELIAPEDETATGPNYKREWVITIDIADGETLTNINILDYLPDNLLYTLTGAAGQGGDVEGSISVTGIGASSFHVTSTPSGDNTPGGNFHFTIDSATGTAATDDIVIRYWTYVPLDDADGSPVIDPATGDTVESTNRVDATADYHGLSLEDSVSDPHAFPNDDTLYDKSIAIQKHVDIVHDLGGRGLSAGDTLGYSLNFQISDFFTFDDIYITDILGDGQLFDPTVAPTLALSGGGSLTFGMDGSAANISTVANLSVIDYGNFAVIHNSDPANALTSAIGAGEDARLAGITVAAGETTIIFFVSDELVSQGRSDVLVGGLVEGMVDGSGANAGATTGSISYQSIVQEHYVNPAAFSSAGDSSVDMGDRIESRVTINGRVLDNEKWINESERASDDRQEDGSSTVLIVPGPELQKSVYAVNGVEGLPGAISSGDLLTYKLTLDLPTADVEHLEITDYIPLPKFEVGDLSQANFQVIKASDLATTPLTGSGTMVVVLDDAVYDHLVANSELPKVEFNAEANAFTVKVGSFDLDGSPSTIIEVYFTVIATDKAMADGLLLTNQMTATYHNTSTVKAIDASIVQVKVQEPVLKLYKGVVGHDDDGFAFGSGQIAFGEPGSASGFSGALTNDILLGSELANAIGESSLIEGVDAGDTVRFALVVENTGRGDAYDVIVTDTLPDQYEQATNFHVQLGDGTVLQFGTDYTITSNGNSFTIELTDGAGNGAIAAGKLSNVDTNNDGRDDGVVTGENYVIITYDAKLKTAAESSSTLTNEAAITSYAGTEGGSVDNNRVIDPKIVSATVQLDSPGLVKTLTGTEVTGTGNNAADEAVIGEYVYYTLTITIPEGTTSTATLLDQLDAGLGFVSIDSVTYSSGVTSTNTIGTGDHPAFVTVSGDGSTLTFDFGDIVNTDIDNTEVETITINYTAVVLNTTGNQGGTELGNEATFEYSYQDQAGATPGPVQQGILEAESELLTIVEPILTISMTASADGTTYSDSVNTVDADDEIYYKIVITNTGGPTAWDIDLNAFLPIAGVDGLAVNSVSSTGTVLVTDGGGNSLDINDFAITGSTLGLAANTKIDIESLSSLTIIVKGQLNIDVVPGSDLLAQGDEHTSATVTWSSLDGKEGVVRSDHNTDGVERDGSDGIGGALNDYAARDTTNVVIKVPENTKTIVATSESNTGYVDGMEQVSVGEIVRYQIKVLIPEGTSPDLQIVDHLPPGMVFINDGTTTVRFVSDSGNDDLDSSVLGSLVNDAETDLHATQISTSATADIDIYNSGTDVRFKLGDVVNSNTDNTQAEYIIIEFNALVLNELGNQAGETLTNQASTRVNGDTVVGNTASVDVRVAEARLEVSMVPSTTGPVDAGDTFTYTITISNTASGNTATSAFDIHLVDILDAFKTSNPTVELEIVNVPGGIDISNLGSDLTIDAPTYTTLLANDSSSAGLDLTFNRLDAGDEIELVVTVRVVNEAPAGADIENTATVTYTSLAGDSGTEDAATGAAYGTTHEGAITSTHASAIANAGAGSNIAQSATERDGSDIPTPEDNSGPDDDAILNNYSVATTTHTPLAKPTIDKQYKDGTLSDDDTTIASSEMGDVVIGEQLTYDIVVTLPEGTTQGLQINDIIPEGLRVDQVELILDGFDGTLTDPTGGVTAAGGTTLNLDFGDVTVLPTDGTQNNSFIIRVTATVENVASNQEGQDLIGGSNLTFLDPDGADDLGTPERVTIQDVTTHNNPLFTVAEAMLTVSKTVSDHDDLDAGDTVTYTITITNNSGQAAYDITLSDALSEAFNGTSAVLDNVEYFTGVTVTDEATNGAFEIVQTGGTWYLQTTAGADIDILQGGSIVITFSVDIGAGVAPSTDVENTVAVKWTSTDGTNTDERTGDDVPFVDAPESFDQADATPLNNYALSSGVSITFTQEIVAEKTLVPNPDDINGDGFVTPGEVVTYKITVRLPEGVAPDFQIRDLIPSGMQFVEGSIVLDTTAFGGTVNAPTALPVTDAAFGDGTGVLFEFGEITTDADNDVTNNTFSFTYQAVVLDSANVNGIDGSQTTHDNSAAHNNGAGSDFTYDAGIVELLAVEPRLEVTKTVDNATPDIDDTVTFTLTISNLATNGSTTTAYDIRVRDALPAGLENISGITVNGATVLHQEDNTSILDLVLDKIELGDTVTITFKATVENTLATIGTTITNTVDLYYDNLPDEEGTYPGTGNENFPGDPDGNSGDRDYTTSGDVELTVNTASLSGTVYHDINNDGIIDAGELGIAGVLITLTGTTETGVPVSLSTTTDADGNYTFDGLAKGVYILTQTQPTDYLDGKESVTGAAFGGVVNNTIESNTITGITIPAGSTTDAVGYNFGEVKAATISGSVYVDYNNDGVFDADEVGIEGVIMILSGIDDRGEEIDAIHFTTGPGGFYEFTDLRPGTYTVTQTPVDDYLDGKETVGSTTGTVVNNIDSFTITGIEVTGAGDATSHSEENLFGNLNPSSLSGFVYLDHNDDGIKGTTESGLPGVKITLTGTDDRGEPVTRDVYTDENGEYQFTGLRPGTYRIEESQPTAYLDGKDTVGGGLVGGSGNHNGTVGGDDVFEGIVIENVHPDNNAGTGYNFGEQFDAGLVKTVEATSEAHTIGSDVAIGETVHYRLVFAVPYGTVYDVALLDDFLQSSGLQFLPESARIALIGEISSSNTSLNGGVVAGSDPAGVQATWTLDDDAVSSERGSNASDFSSGSDVWFKLGDLTNTSADGSPAYVVIEFDAVVVNEEDNATGRTLGNQFELYWDRDGDQSSTDPADHVGTSGTVDVTVVEPEVSLTHVISADTSFDAGDTVTITLTISNSNTGSTAFDLVVSDILHGKFDLVDVAFNDNGTDAVWAFTGDYATDLFSGTISQLEAGESVMLTLTTTLRDTVNPSETLDSSATVTWTSLPGAGTDTPGDPGDATGERTGEEGDTLNHYITTAGGSIQIAEQLTVDKSLVGGSTTPQIGDVLTYQLAVTVIEGTTLNLALADSLPVDNGENLLVYEAGSARISDANGMTVATLNTAYDPATNQLVFTIASVSNPGAGDIDTLASGTLYITYDVVVADTPANSGVLNSETELINTVSATATGTTPTGPVDGPPVTVTEPLLRVDKSVDDTTPDIGQTLTYELVVKHTAESTATAYDVIIKDALPAGLTVDLDTILINGVPLAESPLVVAGSDESTGSQILFSLSELAVGQEIVVTYEATVSKDHSYLAETLDNNVRIYWDTQAGGEVNSVYTGDVTGDGPDRDYGATGPDEPHDDDLHPEQDTHRVTVNNNTIGGYVYWDVDADKIYTGGVDVGIGNVTVKLEGYDVHGQRVELETTTLADGSYTFEFVPPSDADGYIITEIQPTGYLDAFETSGTLGGETSIIRGDDTISGIVVPEHGNATATGYNFGEVKASTISGSVYEDYNNDGARDAGEPGLEGVIITLTGTDIYGADVNLSVETEADGSYTFDNLRPSDAGGYILTQTQPVTHNDGKETGGNPAWDTTVNDVISGIVIGQDVEEGGNLFAELPFASISGYVFNDLNGDGVRDPGEHGIYNVQIVLTGIDDLGNTVTVDPVWTDATGYYEFTKLRPGTYTVLEVQPSGYVSGINSVGTGFEDGLGNSNGTVVGDELRSITIFNVAPGNNTGTEFNFAEILDLFVGKNIVGTDQAHTEEGTADTAADPRPVAIGEVVRYQLILEIPEGVLSDVIVREFLPEGLFYIEGSARIAFVGNGAGVLLDSSTLGDGFIVAAGDPSLVTPTYLLDASAISSDLANTAVDFTSGGTVYFHLGTLTNAENSAAKEYVVIEFDARVLDEASNVNGELKENTFDLLYDRNGDGETEPGERITGIDPGDGPVVTIVEPKMVVTKASDDADGKVYAGQFVNYTITLSNLASNGSSATAFDVIVRDLIPDGMTYVAGTLASDGTPQSLTIVDGKIEAHFDAIELGETITITFRVQVSTDAVSGDGFDNNVRIFYDSLPGGDDANTFDPEDNAPQPDGPDRDYGPVPGYVEEMNPPTPDDDDPHQATDSLTVGTGVISDTVWFDRDGDGVHGLDEAGLGGVTVELYAADGITLLATKVTDADGHYAFENLADGTFIVRVVTDTLPDGLETVPTFDYDGISSPHESTVTLVDSDEINTDVDFGYRGLGTIGDQIFVDNNSNGRFDRSDDGIPGVTVVLTWYGENGREDIIMTTLTDARGIYFFDGLMSGEYHVQVIGATVPKNLIPSLAKNSKLGGYDTVLSLMQSEINQRADFGYKPPSILTNIPNEAASHYYQEVYNPTFRPWGYPGWELVETQPIYSSPMLTGHAEPGSSIVFKVYDDRGQLVTTDTVLVGTGGNWTKHLHGVQGPVRVEAEVSGNNFSALRENDDNFNFRTNYISSLQGGYFQSRYLSVDKVFSDLAYARMEAMTSGDSGLLALGSRKGDYEFLAESALPGSNN